MIYWGTRLRLQYLGPAQVLREYLSIFVHPPFEFGTGSWKSQAKSLISYSKMLYYLQPLEVEKPLELKSFSNTTPLFSFFSAKLLERIVLG